jgi:WD40 repeat protein
MNDNNIEILNLFKESQPKFETTLPFSKQKVLFTAFKVKDSKKITLVLQEENKKLALISLYECIKENSNLKNIENICLADAEFLFLQMRSKSVDEHINVTIQGNKSKINIFDIQSKNDIQIKSINSGTNIILNLKTPTLNDLMKYEIFDDSIYAKACIKSFSINGQIYDLNKFIPKDLNELIDNIPLTISKEINQFILNEPKLVFIKQDEESGSEVTGFLSFFI